MIILSFFYLLQYTQLNTAKNAVYYHHQLSLQEDQGIDMTQVSHIVQVRVSCTES